MSDTTTTAAAAPDISGLSQDQINQLLASLHLGQGLPNIQPDRTPVDSSGFGGGLRHVVSLLGEFAGSPGPETLKALSPAEREQAGIQALSRFGTGLLQASGSGQWIGTNLGNAFAHAERGYDTTTKQALGALAAKQGYAVEDQRAQLDRLKAALPLLSLKQKLEAINALPATLGGGAPNVGAVGADTYVGAIAGHEGTGQNPNSSAVGVGQFLDSTWQDFIKANPQYLAGMTPEQAMAARKNPEFGAKVGPIAIEWLAKQNADELQRKGVTPSGPLLGIAHYLGAGSAGAIAGAPDNAPVSAYVSSDAVKANPELARMTVGQMKARYANTPAPSFMRPAQPTPGQTATAPAPVGTQPPNTPVTIPSPGAPNAARPSLPPPEAPLAGTAQTAGPAAPTGNVIPPSPPGSDAAVATIIEGMVARGADPTTLAPGPGSAPAPMPGAVVTAQAAPPAPPPDSFEAYKLAHPITPDDTQRSLFNPQPDATQLQRFEEQKRSAQQHYEQLYQAAKRGADPAAAAKAREDYAVANQAIIDKENTLRENARKLGVETQAKYLADQEKQRFDAWTKERDDAREQAKAQQKLANDVTLKEKEAELTQKTAAMATEGTRVSKQRDEFDTARGQIVSNIDNFQMLKAFSDAAGKSTPLETMQYGGRSGRDILVNSGMGTEAQRKTWGAQQAFEGLINKTIMGLRAGFSMGSLSDGDMRFLHNLGPSQLQDPTTRADVIAYLEQAEYRKRDYMNKVEDFYDDGKGMSWSKARRAAENAMPDYIVKMPADFEARPPAAQHAFLKDNNLRHGNLVRLPNGSLSRIEIGQ